MITGLDHITINVKDPEKSKSFYKNVLGLKGLNETDMGDHRLMYFELPQGVRLELIDYYEERDTASVSEEDKGIYRHFCLVTDDINGILKKCENENVYIRKFPSYVDNLKCTTMLITDVNGVEIEIIQR